MFNAICTGLLISSFVLLASCASYFHPLTDEESVSELSLKRLGFLQDINYEDAYEFMTPGYRQIKSIDMFKLDYAGASNIRSFDVRTVSCQNDTCKVFVDVEYDLGASGPGMNIIRTNIETWIRTNNKWWFVRSQ